MKAAVKKLYRIYLYKLFKKTEQKGREKLFALLSRLPGFNSFRWFKIPLSPLNIQEEMIEISNVQVRKLPNTIEHSLPSRFHPLRIEIPSAGIAVIQGGFSTATAANLTEKGALISNFTEQFTAVKIENHRLFNFRFSRLFQSIQHFDKTVATLTVDGQTNYYHWLFDVLPKIHLIRKAGLNPDCYYVDQSRPFQKLSLQSLGIEESKIIPIDKYPLISAKELIVSHFPCLSGTPTWACDFLNRTFTASKEEQNLKIFITRKGADYRRILNEEAVVKELEERGFEIIQSEKLNFFEQIRLFSRAKVIVAPHGAGFANLVFCRPHTKVVEIFAPRFPCSCYWSLSNIMKLDYTFILGEDDPKTYSQECEGYDEIIVSIDKLKKILNLIERCN